MNRSYKLILLAVVLSMLIAAACAPAGNQNLAPEPAFEQADSAEAMGAVTTPQPEKRSFGVFETKDVYGNEVNQSVFADANLTMVNIWGTFCGPCLAEMPDLKALSQEMADRNVQVIGIVGDVGQTGEVTGQELDEIKDIIQTTGADYTHLLPSDTIDELVLNNIYAFPTTVFVDRDGNLVGNAEIGSKSKAQWESLIDGYLGTLEPAYAFEDMNFDPGSCCG